MRPTKSPSWIERLLGTAPVAAPPHVFAIDAHELRYASFHRSPQGYVLETSRREELPADLFPHGVLGAPLREPRAFWEILQRFVGGLPSPVKEASLVLPDSWLRLTFTESGDLPRRPAERDDVLRFKLKRLVPFRVEDLRLSHTEVTPFPKQKEPHRLLLGFAIENLLAQLEDAFFGLGITLGRITNTTLALLASLETAFAPDELAALILVEPEAYTLSYLYQGEPLLYRYKAFGDETGADTAPAEVDASAVRRDLRLTSSFVRQHFPDRPLARVFLAAPPETEATWLEWLADGLDAVPEPLAREHLPLARSHAGDNWGTAAPLLGAAALEVSSP